MEKVPLTIKGFATLEEELRHRQQVERPRIIQAISDARSLGDLSENAEYHAAKEKQGHIEARIAHLEGMLSRAEVVEHSQMTGSRVKFGAIVSLEDLDSGEEKTLRIVGPEEAETNSTPGGSSSVTTTPIASPGPLLVTTRRYVNSRSTRTGSGRSTLEIARSAGRLFSLTVSVPDALPGEGIAVHAVKGDYEVGAFTFNRALRWGALRFTTDVTRATYLSRFEDHRRRLAAGPFRVATALVGWALSRYRRLPVLTPGQV